MVIRLLPAACLTRTRVRAIGALSLESLRNVTVCARVNDNSPQDEDRHSLRARPRAEPQLHTDRGQNTREHSYRIQTRPQSARVHHPAHEHPSRASVPPNRMCPIAQPNRHNRESNRSASQSESACEYHAHLGPLAIASDVRFCETVLMCQSISPRSRSIRPSRLALNVSRLIERVIGRAFVVD